MTLMGQQLERQLEDKPFGCVNCEERFSDPEDAHRHSCNPTNRKQRHEQTIHVELAG